MAMLTVGGVPVELESFTENDTIYAGTEGRGFDNAAWSQLRDGKRSWSARTAYLTAAELAALRAAAPVNTTVTVANTIDGVSMTAYVRVREVTDFQASSDGLLRRAALAMVEA